MKTRPFFYKSPKSSEKHRKNYEKRRFLKVFWQKQAPYALLDFPNFYKIKTGQNPPTPSGV